MTVETYTLSGAIHQLLAVRDLTCIARDRNDDLTDPDQLVFTMREPDGVLTSFAYGTDPEVVRDSLGEFHVAWTCAKPGRHHWRYDAHGNLGGAAEEAQFLVRASQVLP